MERIVIIDGNSLINRAFYAMQRPMITKEGIYTQGIYGFINMLNKIESDYEPEYITVAFDLKAPTFRHLEYDQYKAGRKPMPPGTCHADAAAEGRSACNEHKDP